MRVKLFLLFLFLVCCCMPIELLAQKERIKNLEQFDRKWIHFGFSLSINRGNFIMRPNDQYLNDSLYGITLQHQPGFSLGIVSDLRIFDNFNLRFIPSLTFATRQVNFTFANRRGTQYDIAKTIESTFLEFPLLLKFKSQRVNNYRMYVIGGMKYALDMSSNKDVANLSPDKVVMKIVKSDFLYEAGFGMDFYLNYFKLSPEIKYAFGMRNLLVNDNTIFSNSIESLRSRMIYLSLTFE
jgi:hypothetical protein